jgi:hypothetical protein
MYIDIREILYARTFGGSLIALLTATRYSPGFESGVTKANSKLNYCNSEAGCHCKMAQ